MGEHGDHGAPSSECGQRMRRARGVSTGRGAGAARDASCRASQLAGQARAITSSPLSPPRPTPARPDATIERMFSASAPTEVPFRLSTAAARWGSGRRSSLARPPRAATRALCPAAAISRNPMAVVLNDRDRFCRPRAKPDTLRRAAPSGALAHRGDRYGVIPARRARLTAGLGSRKARTSRARSSSDAEETGWPRRLCTGCP